MAIDTSFYDLRSGMELSTIAETGLRHGWVCKVSVVFSRIFFKRFHGKLRKTISELTKLTRALVILDALMSLVEVCLLLIQPANHGDWQHCESRQEFSWFQTIPTPDGTAGRHSSRIVASTPSTHPPAFRRAIRWALQGWPEVSRVAEVCEFCFQLVGILRQQFQNSANGPFWTIFMWFRGRKVCS